MLLRWATRRYTLLLDPPSVFPPAPWLLPGLANLGDLDGDGVPDLSMTAEEFDDGTTAFRVGAVFILFMNSTGGVEGGQAVRAVPRASTTQMQQQASPTSSRLSYSAPPSRTPDFQWLWGPQRGRAVPANV